MHFCYVGGIKCIYEIKQNTFHKLKIAQHNRFIVVVLRLLFAWHQQSSKMFSSTSASSANIMITKMKNEP